MNLNEHPLPPVYIDGILKLHAQLAKSYHKAMKVAGKVLGFTNQSRSSNKAFNIYVDFDASVISTQLRGWFMYRNAILRFLPIEFDKALLYPVRNHGGGVFRQSKGFTEDKIFDCQLESYKKIIRFRPIFVDGDQSFYMSKIADVREYLTPLEYSNGVTKIDDLGPLVYEFPDIQKINLADTPDNLKNKPYTLVGKQYYAPLSTDSEIHCVLFAETDNLHDSNAIKVLRWLPGKKGKETEPLTTYSFNGGDYFFELGYVSRLENQSLHRFMVENDSRLLFGRVNQDKITIDGGIKVFQSNDLKYPRCLYSIPVV